MTTLDGLQNTIGWWSASLDSGARGTLVATDLSSNTNNGTLTNMDGATDWPADTGNGGTHAWDFDGVNDHIAISASMVPTGSAAKSVSLWFKTSTTVSTRQWLFYSGTETTRGRFSIELESSKITFNTEGDAFYHDATISSDTWYHVVLIYQAGTTTAVMYVNGVRQSFTIPAVLATGTTTTTRIGSFNGSLFMLQGRMDDVRVISRAINENEVYYLYQQRSRLNQPGYSTNSLRNGLIYCVAGLQDHTAASYGLSQSQSANFLNMLIGLSAATIIVWARQVAASDAYLILSGPTNLCTIFNRGGTTALWFYFNGQTYTTGTGNNIASTPTMCWMRKGSGNVDAGRNTTRLFGPTANASAFTAPNSSVNISQSGAPVQSLALWSRELSDAELALVHAAGPEIALPEATAGISIGRIISGGV
jgi:hypothetical protein